MKLTWKGAVVVAAVAGLLTGCSNPGAPAESTGEVTWPAQSTKLDGTTLTVWAAASSTKTADSVIAGFEKATGAKVNVVTIPDPYEQGVQTKVATGDKPDLAFWQPTSSQLTALNAAQNLQPLTNAPWLSNYKDNLADITGQVNGTRYAALFSAPAVQGVYYNKDVFAKAGITKTPKNWEEFIAAARQIKDKGTTPFFDFAGGGSSWATQWWVQVQLADAAKAGLWDRVNTGKEKFTDSTIQTAVNNYNNLIKDGLFNSNIKTATFEDQGKALLAGDAAMVVQINGFAEQLQQRADTATLNKKIGFFPISPTGNVATVIPDQGNALVAFKTGDSNREAAARQFLAYWLGDGYSGFVKAQGAVSIEKGVDTPSSVPDALTAAVAAVPTAVGSMQASAIANPDLYINLGDMIQGTKTPQQVTEATQQQFAGLAKAQGAAGF
ncbi:ABC transporter substrate-binding protein [Arthrobacter sp. NPDC056727]|uniref:ABC transporter substrate-binding protein n=1 Tax=Arthrobacter sp. NPDC056727 TaxID=3345927 RepID=UPI00366DD7E0